MATALELVEQDVLESFSDEYGDSQNNVFATKRAIGWLNSELPDIEVDGFYDDAPDPTQQMDELLAFLFTGEGAASTLDPHSMEPKSDGIWEIRSMDLRIVGWFWRKGQFVISAIATASACKQYGLYAGLREQSKWDRNSLDLDEPKFVNGEISDVI